MAFRMVKQVVKGQKAKKPAHKFTISCTDPVEDNVLVMKDFQAWLESRIKVDGKLGNLGSAVSVSLSRSDIVVETKIAFSKRYLKYLTKKYLASQQLRQYLRVIATGKNTYELKFLAVNNDQEDAE